MGSKGVKSPADRKGTNSDGTDGERATAVDLGANNGADFQISLATATSIAGLTAYAAPIADKSAYVSDEDIAADAAPPLDYQAADQMLSTLMQI